MQKANAKTQRQASDRIGGTEIALGIQHLFAMFGATVLVPLLTNMNPAVALATAGIGTLIFHACTKFKVPVFVGSSFAFIPGIAAAVASKGVEYAQGGIIAAGLVYLVFALLVFLIGTDKIKKLFPPVVTGPVIVVIGIGLAGTAINDALGGLDVSAGFTAAAGANLGIAVFTLFVVILCTIFAKGFFKLVPILIGIASGYVLCAVLGLLGLFPMDYSAFETASWINIPYVTEFVNDLGQKTTFFSLPKFDWGVIISIAPVALVTFMEHIGDITTNGAVVGKNFFADPGLHRTLLGDGLATAVAGFVGGPANTTYSENTGVLATTKNYNPKILRLAAVFAIILGFVGKFGALLQTIPAPVKGGVEMMLFGMIASIGIRTLAESKLDFTHSRNLIIVAVILVTGLGINTIGGLTIAVAGISISVSGLFVATVLGVLLNALLPEEV